QAAAAENMEAHTASAVVLPPTFPL
ncbi:hypothetical protein CCACVL1_16138, partial [Corchorus capsularis]